MTTTVHALRCEYHINPLGLDVRRPRLGWKLRGDGRGLRQTAYQVQVSASPRFDHGLLWDTGRVETDQSVHVPYGGLELSSGQRCHWRVRLWDQTGTPTAWSDPAWWELGLLSSDDWRARWIEPEGEVDPQAYKPAPHLRRAFTLPSKPIARARAYVTAHGVYEFSLNGQVAGDEVLAPGFTTYHKRLQVQTYDVTSLLTPGDNVAGAILADGWWRGKTSGLSLRNVYGQRLALLAQVHILYADGSEDIIVTDDAWRAATGPLLKSDMKDGDIYDARLEMPGWNAPGFDDSAWTPVRMADYNLSNLVGSNGPKIRPQETFTPKLLAVPNGETVLDFGQNIAGWVRFRVDGPAGLAVRLIHGETLDQHGNFTISNFNPAKAIARALKVEDLVQAVTYTLKGGGELYEPRFTFHGFRYVKLENWPGAPRPEDFTAVAVYSAIPPTGDFECSHPLVNQLHHNITWSQKGNFLDIPTDCPHRERAGYTGDAQVFARTGSILHETASFFHKWLLDIAADQRDTGMVAIVVPDPGAHVNAGLLETTNGSAGWGDAITIVPWTLYQVYGDTRVLADLYPAMRAWVGYMEQHARQGAHWSRKLSPARWGQPPAHAAYIWDSDFHFGEWAEPGTNYAIELVSSLLFPRPSVATAFFAHSARLTARTAEVLGHADDARRYADLAGKVRAAWNAEFARPDGRLIPDTQATYVRALAFDLLPEAQRPAAARRLAELIRANDYHIGTGFLATPDLCHVLTQFGYLDEAYRLLLQEEQPSWLYPVTRGATTVWEFWDAVGDDGRLKMSSHNHYSPGSVGSWLYQVVAGLETGAPGYKRLLIQPRPGGGLTHARAAYETLYGPAASAWRLADGHFHLDVTIPPNTDASVRLPRAAGLPITESGQPVSAQPSGPDALLDLAPGTYAFAYPWPSQPVDQLTS